MSLLEHAAHCQALPAALGFCSGVSWTVPLLDGTDSSAQRRLDLRVDQSIAATYTPEILRNTTSACYEAAKAFSFF